MVSVVIKPPSIVVTLPPVLARAVFKLVKVTKPLNVLVENTVPKDMV